MERKLSYLHSYRLNPFNRAQLCLFYTGIICTHLFQFISEGNTLPSLRVQSTVGS